MLLFLNSCIKENHHTVYIVLETLKFFICYYYKMCEITTKLPF